MLKAEFTKILKKNNLEKKEFATLTKLSYNTVNNWNDTNKPIPSWVPSWLDNYEKAQTYYTFKDKVLEIEGYTTPSQ